VAPLYRNLTANPASPDVGTMALSFDRNDTIGNPEEGGAGERIFRHVVYPTRASPGNAPE
jgi:hypothetical protein